MQRQRSSRVDQCPRLVEELKLAPAYALVGLTFITVTAISGMWVLGLVAVLALGATLLLYISLAEL